MIASNAVILLLFFGILLGIADAVCYALARYPERRKWYFKLPGGGIAALLILGRNRS